MILDTYYLVNLFLIIAILLKFYNNLLTLIIFLFIYISLHYVTSLSILFEHIFNNLDCFKYWDIQSCKFEKFHLKQIEMHKNGLGNYVGFCAAFFYLIINSLLFVNFLKNRKLYIFILKENYYFFIPFLSSSLVIITLSSTNLLLSFGEGIKYDEVKTTYYFLSSFFFITFSTFYFLSKNNLNMNIDFILKILIFLLICYNIISIFEVFTGFTYNFTSKSTTGLSDFRSSSTFFNPNVYSIWLSTLFLFITYSLWKNNYFIFKKLILLILISIAFYFTGSRSLFMVFLASILGITILMPKQKYRFYPILIFVFTFIVIYALSKLAVIYDIGIIDLTKIKFDAYKYLSHIDDFYQRNMGYAGFSSLERLGERFFLAPLQTVFYLIKLIKDKFEIINTGLNLVIPNFELLYDKIVSKEVLASIKGRVDDTKMSSDSGWIGFKYLFNGISLILFFLQILLLVVISIAQYYYSRNINSSFIIGVCIFYLMSGVLIKFYLFPVILIFSIIQSFVIYIMLKKTTF